MADTKQTVTTTVQRTVSVTLTENQAAEMIRRQIVGAPDNAQVTFDCGYDYLREVCITWSTVEVTEQ